MSKHKTCYDSAPAHYDSVLVKTLSQTAHACHGGFKDSTRAAMPARAEKDGRDESNSSTDENPNSFQNRMFSGIGQGIKGKQ